MAIDYAVHLDCPVKQQLGDGDDMAGEAELLRLLKAKGYAKALEKLAQQQGKDFRTLRTTINSIGEDGQPESCEVSYAELVNEAKPLAGLESACNGCSANALQRGFGCQGATKYPIHKQAEQWLMQQVQTLDTVAGPYLVLATENSEEGLERIRGMRHDGLFESRQPIRKEIGGKQSPGAQLDSDDVLELFLGRGDLLDPGYCLMILLGLAGISLDGAPAVSETAFGTLLEMDDVSERQSRTSFAFQPSPETDVVGLQALLRAMYYAWRNDVPFLVSS